MQVIITATGELKNVPDGYARNYLLPRKLAQPATGQAVKDATVKRAAWEADQLAKKADLQKMADALKAVHLTVTAKANEQGKLFAAVHTAEIQQALAAQNFIIDADNITVEPMKQVGEYTCIVSLPQVEAVKLPVTISAE